MIQPGTMIYLEYNGGMICAMRKVLGTTGSTIGPKGFIDSAIGPKGCGGVTIGPKGLVPWSEAV